MILFWVDKDLQLANNKTSHHIFRYMSPSLLHPACCPSNKTLKMDKTRALMYDILFESKREDGLLGAFPALEGKTDDV